ncbi:MULTISPECIES: hypothetical protein [unclassified Micromonospora]|uniref:hypothetical protein n=1 Tax=unclassified Micromonospora TaxID=2617518 RepID=UPI00363F2DCC
MEFDPARYDREVIGPLRGRRGRLPDGDLRVRYAVEPGMDRAALEQRLRKVRTYWNQKASGPAAQAATGVCKRLLAADEELKRTAGSAMLDPAWWEQQATAYRQRARGALDGLVRDLRDSYGGSGRVTPGQLAAIVAHHQATFDRDQLDQAVRQAKLVVVEPVELPADSGMERTAYRTLTENLGIAGAQTIVHLLHPDLRQPFRLCAGFAVPGRPELALTAEVVRARSVAENAAADSPVVRARKAALVALRTAADRGIALASIALFQAAEQLRQGRAAGLADRLLVRAAVDLGLTPEDAELLVLSMPATVAAAATPADQVRELLGRGELRTAAQRLAAVPAEHADRETLRREIAAAEQRVVELLDQVDQALAADREEAAEQLLRQALAAATDDDALDSRLRRLRPPPPQDLRVRPGAPTVLSWARPATERTDLRYRVVRGDGSPPETPQAGTLVAETTEPTAADPEPPVGTRCGYAVFAASESGAWSRAVTATAVLTPPVGEVTVLATQQQVTLTWRPHPATVAVRVRRTESRRPGSPDDGTPIRAELTGLTDAAVQQGRDYHYSLVAVYRGPAGQQVTSAMVVVTAAPRPRARPVESLAVEPVRVIGNRVRVRISWLSQPGIQVRIRRAGTPPPWPVGATVHEPALDGYGAEVTGAPTEADGRCVLEADVPQGFHVYLPLAVGGEGVLAGRPVTQGTAAPVERLRAQRAGDQVSISWVWPDAVSLAEVTHARDGSPDEVFQVSRSRYLHEKGCRLTADDRPGRVAVVGIAVGPAGQSRSPAVCCDVPGRPGRLAYTVERLAGLRNRFSPRRALAVTAERDCAVAHLVVVARAGPVLPVRPDQGRELLRVSDVEFGAGQTRRFEFDLPRELSRPYWIRCFVDPPSGAVLRDPPVDQLKV